MQENFEFEGLERALHLISILERNQDPPPGLWEALFNTPGYRALMEREFNRDFFQTCFRLAFKPSLTHEQVTTIADKSRLSSCLIHLMRVSESRGQIEAQVKFLKASAIMKDALQLAQRYLPTRTPQVNPDPQVSFLLFEDDARGYSPIVIDILHSIKYGNQLKFLLAHEIHHYYRDKDLSFSFPQESADTYKVLWILNQLHAEGVADLIDKSEIFGPDGCFANSQWAKTYNCHMEESKTILQRMGRLLLESHLGHIGFSDLGNHLYGIIPMSGHPTGNFMARTILNTLGVDSIIEGLGSPFQFIAAYNTAAQDSREDYPILPDSAMNTIRELEKLHSDN